MQLERYGRRRGVGVLRGISSVWKIVLSADHVVRRGGWAVEGSSQALGGGLVMYSVTLTVL